MASVMDWIVLIWAVSQLVSAEVRKNIRVGYVLGLICITFFLLLLHLSISRMFLFSLIGLIVFLYARDCWQSWLWFIGFLLLFVSPSPQYIFLYFVLEGMLWWANRDKWWLLSLYSIVSIVLASLFVSRFPDVYPWVLVWQGIALLKALSSCSRHWYGYLWMVSIRSLILWLVPYLNNKIPLMWQTLPIFLAIVSLPWIVSDKWEKENEKVPLLSWEMAIAVLVPTFILLGLGWSIFTVKPYILAGGANTEDLLLVSCLLSMGICLREVIFNWICGIYSSNSKTKALDGLFWLVLIGIIGWLAVSNKIAFGYVVFWIATGLTALIVIRAWVKREKMYAVYVATQEFLADWLSSQYWQTLFLRYSVGPRAVWAFLRRRMIQVILALFLSLGMLSYVAVQIR